ncbi:corticotropin-releasing factor receptor 2-like [Dermacentor andersoni]|uniref:corticotropin-releasing factor receptor 2-like n=1 Tax=Dermacentor andersoni TaxID=34620 RepID=UPI003B3AED24
MVRLMKMSDDFDFSTSGVSDAGLGADVTTTSTVAAAAASTPTQFLWDVATTIVHYQLTEDECAQLQKDENAEGSWSAVQCPAAWDSFTCWPPTAAGKAVRKPCTDIIASLDVSLDIGDVSLETGLYAYRVCGPNGDWLWGNWTNYTECLGLINHEPQEMSAVVSLAVSYILLLFSLLSLIFLSATMFIFCYFRSLQCSRTRVHQNLVLALMVHAIMLVVLSMPVVLNSEEPTPFAQIPPLCKSILSLKMYAAMASINWMFVEGLLLHSRITICIFRQDAPFKLYHAIGWGLPLVFILTWAYLMEQELRTACWEGYGANRYVWLLIGPRLVAILVNFVFLVNIIRILVTRVKSAVSVETTQFRKAIKATVLLFPLLGITHLLFCINPQDENMGLKEAYMVINAILQSSQGIFVSVLYCFMNSEVQTAVRNAYLRAAIRRNPNKERSFLRGGYSQTSTVFMSHFNGSVAEQSASPKAGSKVVRKYPLRATAGPQRISRNPCAVAAV